tara:strand:+ start:532 stop:807 length:276 start_codon:yes stop_codon:yes gene_type:complete
MSEEIKFSDEEMNGIKEVQTDYITIQNKFGQLAIAKLNLQDKINEVEELDKSLNTQFLELKQKEQELVEQLSEKYGQGNLDPKTGVFTPVE